MSNPIRSVDDVGPGDSIKDTSNQLHTILRIERIDKPRSWIVHTTGGRAFTMYQINRYLKAGDKE